MSECPHKSQPDPCGEWRGGGEGRRGEDRRGEEGGEEEGGGEEREGEKWRRGREGRRGGRRGGEERGEEGMIQSTPTANISLHAVTCSPL